MPSDNDTVIPLDGHRLLRGLERLERGLDPLEPTQSAPGLQVAGRLYRAIYDAIRRSQALEQIGELDVRRTMNRALADYMRDKR